MHTPTPHSPANSQLSGLVRLENLGVIRAAGEDAVKFLQGQLTQDVALMRADEAHLAAFCNAKGRMQASFVVFSRDEDEILMVCSKDILAQTLKRLSMFVMRAKARLTDVSDDFKLFGVAGSAIESIAKAALPYWSKADLNGQNLISLYPGAGVQRALLCLPVDTPPPALPALPDGIWEWLEVQSGIAMITLPIFEAFVPQMLNYESIGGVNFKKGCYPGQEIVARSQFRGTLKRRAYVAHTNLQPAVGQDVFHVSDSAQPCGLVAAAAANPQGGFDMVVSMQTSAAADAGDGKLTLGSSEGAALRLLPLPYELLADI